MVVKTKMQKKTKKLKENEKIENYDASGLVYGRLASMLAQKLLAGYKINVYNAEKVVITGNPKCVVTEYSKRYDYRAKGNPEKGPKYPKVPHLMLKLAVIKMLPKGARGKALAKNIKVYIGNENKVDIKSISLAKMMQGLKFIELGELCNRLGAKW
ncbi:MAG: 50S ribosomal protein L13 [Candidatus Diapherotrites archaeon CG08_land_8_20_14_0_20_30_16]|nr:MAG: 50S ribosomal protein L13 [Candidatus Diapherotrites archaeon CG08_land_8_20_14_0_20_30_16]